MLMEVGDEEFIIPKVSVESLRGSPGGRVHAYMTLEVDIAKATGNADAAGSVSGQFNCMCTIRAPEAHLRHWVHGCCGWGGGESENLAIGATSGTRGAERRCR